MHDKQRAGWFEILTSTFFLLSAVVGAGSLIWGALENGTIPFTIGDGSFTPGAGSTKLLVGALLFLGGGGALLCARLAPAVLALFLSRKLRGAEEQPSDRPTEPPPQQEIPPVDGEFTSGQIITQQHVECQYLTLLWVAWSQTNQVTPIMKLVGYEFGDESECGDRRDVYRRMLDHLVIRIQTIGEPEWFRHAAEKHDLLLNNFWLNLRRFSQELDRSLDDLDELIRICERPEEIVKSAKRKNEREAAIERASEVDRQHEELFRKIGKTLTDFATELRCLREEASKVLGIPQAIDAATQGKNQRDREGS